jgi:hypothetical protein
VVVVNRDEPAYLLLNRAPARGNWIGFRVRERGGREALGARLRLAVGRRTVLAVVRTAYSYCAASTPLVHVGLGAETSVGALEVTWADGLKQTFPAGLAPGRVHELVRE